MYQPEITKVLVLNQGNLFIIVDFGHTYETM